METLTPTITIDCTVHSNVEKTWNCYTDPVHITKWNFASDDWHCPSAKNDLRTGGRFTSRMEAKDGSFGFDFEASYDEVVPNKLIRYTMTDGRKATVEFRPTTDSTWVVVTFDAENQNPIEMQKGGWQAILNNFKKHVEKQ